MKPTLLDFNKLEFMVIRGDYQGFKGHGAKVRVICNLNTTDNVTVKHCSII